MLKNYKQRLAHWDTGHDVICMGNSLSLPFLKYIHMFQNKKVLEIGPGGGRQFVVVKPYTDEYAVVDISAEVLRNALYENVTQFLIDDYSVNLNSTFDIIHFWYVIHHVLREELSDFRDFLVRHLNKKGIIIFNTAILSYPSDAYGEDGCLTTPLTPLEIEDVFAEKFNVFIKDDSLQTNASGMIIIASKL